MPLVQLVSGRHWLFDGPTRDAWIYYRYFRFARIYLRESGLETYYASRLSVVLPGYFLRHLLPPLAANALLHLALYGCALAGFYVAARLWCGRRAALLAALALGGNRFFLFEIGTNYVDGFG